MLNLLQLLVKHEQQQCEVFTEHQFFESNSHLQDED